MLASDGMATGVDLVIVGDIFRCDEARSWARALAIEGDRIVAVGTEDQVRERVGPAKDLVTGSTIMPGFQDAHVHPAFAGRNLLNLNLDDLDDQDSYLARIRAFVNANPDRGWIVGGGWLNAVFASRGGPRRELLDAAVPDRPVFLLNTDIHAAWVNSRALELAGLDRSSPDPWDGYLVREADGSPTGTLQEGAAYHVLRSVIPPPTIEEWSSWLRAAQHELHSLGITGWQDAWVEPDLLRAYRSLDDAGELTMRVVPALWWDRHRGLDQIENLNDQRAWGTAGQVAACSVKIMLDGCPGSCTSAMLEPYEGVFGAEHGSGIAFVDAESLSEAVVRLDSAGFQVHQHALGDRALRMALDAVAAARKANGPNDLRHHIAHLQIPDPADLPRLRELGVVANLQPYWAQPDDMITELIVPRVGNRAACLYPLGDLVRRGTVLCFGSDWPVSTPNPWHGLEVAVSRRPVGEPEAQPLDASQRIDLPTAIAAYACGSAYVNHDAEAGTIREGARADVVVLDRNPFDGDAPIGTTTPIMTIASGRVVYDAS